MTSLQRHDTPAPPCSPSAPRDGDSTQTSPGIEWSIGDRVTRLRQIGSSELYPLPVPERSDKLPSARRAKADDVTPVVPVEEEITLGSLETCQICIQDPKGRVSKRHARLYYSQDVWHILDLRSKNGLTVDGVKQLSARLSPGMVLGIGGVPLIAESARLMELRCYLARVMGWGWNGDPADRAVERALQTLRAAQVQREVIWLRGTEDTAQVAQDLHRYLIGGQGPFITCDPKRKIDKGTARRPGNEVDLEKAVNAARGGTLCVRACRLPEGFAALVESLRTSEDLPAQIIVCDDDVHRERPEFLVHPLVIPPVSERPVKERENVVREYFFDAMASLGVSALPRPEDRAWVMAHSSGSLQDIAKGALRLLALRVKGSFLAAASALDMRHQSLIKWVTRRQALPWLANDLSDEADDDTSGGESAE